MDRPDSCDRGCELPGGASSEESHIAAVATAADAKRTCAECGTSKTPLWRSGPAGPKSLCNACGIRSRKKRRAILGLEDKKPGKISPGSTKNNGASRRDHRRGVELGESLKRGILSIGKHVAMPRSSAERRPRKKVGGGEEEEEQAAMLLMALSYGLSILLELKKNPVEMRRAK